MRFFMMLGVLVISLFVCVDASAYGTDACKGYSILSGTYGKQMVEMTFQARGYTCYATVTYSNGAGSEVYIAEPRRNAVRLRNYGSRLYFGKRGCYSTLRHRGGGSYTGFVCGAQFVLDDMDNCPSIKAGFYQPLQGLPFKD